MKNADKCMIGFCSVWGIAVAIMLCVFGKNVAQITTYVFVGISAIVVVVKESNSNFRSWLRKR